MSHRRLIVVTALVANVACVTVYSRHGLVHHVAKETGTGAVACGVFTRGALQALDLSAEETAQVDACMTEAYRAGRTAFFHVSGPGIDSRSAGE